MPPASRFPHLDSPVARLGAFGVVLLAALGGGFAIGAAVGTGPEVTTDDPTVPIDDAPITTAPTHHDGTAHDG